MGPEAIQDFQAAGICGAIEKMDPCNHKSHRSSACSLLLPSQAC